MDVTRKPWSRTLTLAVVAAVVAIAAAASSWAASPAPTADPAGSSAPTQYLPAQDDGAQPPDRSAGDHPCPEEGGPGDGDGAGSAAPESQAQPADPTGTATPEV